MAKPIDSEKHLATGTFFQRTLKSLFERFAQKGGQKAGATNAVERVFEKIKAVLSAANIDIDKVFESLTLVLPIILQDPGLWRLIVSWFGLPPDMASELTNDGLDEFLVSFFDAAKAVKDKQEGTHGSMLASAADKAVSGMEARIRERHPQFFEDCVVEEERKLIHRLGCPIMSGMPKTITLPRWQAMQKAVPVLQCVCVGFEADLPGNLNQARNRLKPEERQQFRDMLQADQFKTVLKDILRKGQQVTTITTADLRNILSYHDRDMQRDELTALVGLGKGSSGNPVFEKIEEFFKGFGTVAPEAEAADPSVHPVQDNQVLQAVSTWDGMSHRDRMDSLEASLNPNEDDVFERGADWIGRKLKQSAGWVMFKLWTVGHRLRSWWNSDDQNDNP